MDFKKYDVIIVGAGIAGLYTAINLNSKLKVLVLSKRELTLCNTTLAQGGIIGVFDEQLTDDMLKSGKYQNNRENLRIMVEQGAKDIQSLTQLNVAFDKEPTTEGGHSHSRILHCKDSTGEKIITALIGKVKSLDNVDCVENAHLLRLEKQGAHFIAHTLAHTQRHCYTASVAVIATGGIGRVYNYTTNSDISTGDGIALAYNLGANIKRMDLIQFHPTAYRGEEGQTFLISEAVRGEGGHILNKSGERFCNELETRNIVSRRMIEESQRQNSNELYLDISHKGEQYVKSRFPMIYSELLKKGYDLTKEPVPIFPCQHYLMGGIEVTSNGATNIAGLYAAGECAFTGVHGINRIASSSLLEALVFSRRAAEHINNSATKTTPSATQTPRLEKKSGELTLPEELCSEIRDIMQKSYFVFPDYDRCRKGLARVKAIMETYDNPLATVAYLILNEVLNP